MYGEARVREILESVLQGSSADQTEVLFWGTDQQLTRFAKNTIHQNVAEEGAEITVRVALGRKVGVASGNRLDADGLWTRHHLDSSGQPLRDLQQYLLASMRGRALDG